MEQQELVALEQLVGPDAASPLFARLADAYLSQGRPQDALRVCDQGLAHFPWYSTAHFVKGRILLALRMASEARREFEFVRDWMPMNVAAWTMLDSIEVPEDQVLEATPSAAPSFVQAAPVTAEAEQPASFFSTFTETPAVAPAEVPEPSPAAPVDNVFGLPTEVPTILAEPTPELTEAPSPFSGFSGFDQPAVSEPESPMSAFGGFEPVATPEPEPASDIPSGIDAFGGFAAAESPVAAETASPAGVESFEQFAERVRPTLGPTGTQSLEEYLTAAESASAPPAQDIFSSFATSAPAVEPPSVEAAPSTDTNRFDFGDFPSAPEPVSAPIVETPASSEPPAFDFGGFPSAQESSPEPPTVALPPEPMTDFSGLSFEGPDLSQPPPPQPPGGGPSIEELTEKLQSAKKITPVIDISSKSSNISSEDTLASSGFVTPTLAEIYAKQGWLDDAIKAYKTLARTKPAEKEKFEARIAELEEQKKAQG